MEYTPWLAILLLVLAGVYVVVERGQTPREKVMRWMVITGAILMAVLIGSRAFS